MQGPKKEKIQKNRLLSGLSSLHSRITFYFSNFKRRSCLMLKYFLASKNHKKAPPNKKYSGAFLIGNLNSFHINHLLHCLNHFSSIRQKCLYKRSRIRKRNIRRIHTNNGCIQVVECIFLNTVSHF